MNVLPVLGFTFLRDPRVDAAIVAGIGLLIALPFLLRFRRSKGLPRCRKCWYTLEGSQSLVCPECGHDNTGHGDLKANRIPWKTPAAILLIAFAPLLYTGFAYASVYRLAYSIKDTGITAWGDDNPTWWQLPGYALYEDSDWFRQKPIFDALAVHPFAQVEGVQVDGSWWQQQPTEFPEFAHAENLTLQSINGFDADFLAHFDGMPRLRSVVFRDVEMTAGDAQDHDWIRRVWQISIAQSDLGQQQLRMFKSASSLEHLTINSYASARRMAVTTYVVHPDDFVSADALLHLAGPDELRRLQLNGLDLKPDHLSAIADMHHATVNDVNIWHTTLTKAEMQQIARLQQLDYLKLESCKLTDEAIEPLSRLTRIRILDLSANQLTGPGLAHLSNMHGLTSVYLRKNQIDDAGLAHMPILPRPLSLDLAGNPINGSGIKQFDDLKLKTLGLRGTNFQFENIDDFPESGLLEHVDLSGTPAMLNHPAETKAAFAKRGVEVW